MKTLLYNFIRQEKCPPPATHIFEPKDEGGLLYGLASGVASTSTHIRTQMEQKETDNKEVKGSCFFCNLDYNFCSNLCPQCLFVVLFFCLFSNGHIKLNGCLNVVLKFARVHSSLWA